MNRAVMVSYILEQSMPGRFQSRASVKVIVLGVASLVVLVALTGVMMYQPPKDQPLLMYCAAGMRMPVEEIAEAYEKAYGVEVELQYGGSNTLLNQLEVSRAGDLYLAGDDSYTELASEKGLVVEQFPIAIIRPVLIVKQGNPKKIQSLNDLMREDVRVVLGNPDQAAIGQTTRELLEKEGLWTLINQAVLERGTFMPTVNEVANTLQVSPTIDVGIVWDITAIQMNHLEMIRIDEFQKAEAKITIALIKESQQKTEAMHFSRYLVSSDKGLAVFKKHGFEVLSGEPWKVTELHTESNP